MARERREAELLQQRAERLRLRSGVLDELDAVDADGVRRLRQALLDRHSASILRASAAVAGRRAYCARSSAVWRTSAAFEGASSSRLMRTLSSRPVRQCPPSSAAQRDTVTWSLPMPAPVHVAFGSNLFSVDTKNSKAGRSTGMAFFTPITNCTCRGPLIFPAFCIAAAWKIIERSNASTSGLTLYLIISAASHSTSSDEFS